MASDHVTPNVPPDVPPPNVPADASYGITLTSEDRQWGMFCHLSSLLGLLIGGFMFLGPLICWLVKKDSSKFVDYHGKESLNFQINILIYSIIAAISIFACVGIVLLPAVLIYGVVMAVLAGIKANNGEYYRYPYTFRLIN